MTDQQPPIINNKFEYHKLKQINDSVKKQRVYETPDGERLPSVTTILSKTKDMTHLIEWKKRVGEQEAQRIVTEASGVGTAMHNNLERFVKGEQRMPGKNLVHVKANAMADQIIEKGTDLHLNITKVDGATLPRVDTSIPLHSLNKRAKPCYGISK